MGKEDAPQRKDEGDNERGSVSSCALRRPVRYANLGERMAIVERRKAHHDNENEAAVMEMSKTRMLADTPDLGSVIDLVTASGFS